MSADGWAWLALAAWSLTWALAAWLRDRRNHDAFRKRLANEYPEWWESP